MLPSIERKVLAGFLASTIVLVLLGAIVYRFAAIVVETSDQVSHTREVLATLEMFQRALFQAENAQRGFYLSDGDDRFIADRDEAVAVAKRAIERLRTVSGAAPTEQAALFALETDLGDRIAAFDDLEATWRRSGLAAVRNQLPVAIGPRLTQSMHAAADALAEAAGATLATQRERQAREARRGQVAGGGVLLLLLGFQAWLFWLIRSEMAARLRSESELNASEARLREILEVLPVGVSLADAHGRSTRDNRAAHAIWSGASAPSARSEPALKGWWLRNGHPIGTDEWPIARALRGESSPAEEIEIQCSDGTRKIVLNAATPLGDRDGSLTGAVAVYQDITQLKSAEQSIREAARFDATHREALTLFNETPARAALLESLLDLLASPHPFPVSAFYAQDAAGQYVLAAAHGATAAIRRRYAAGEGLVGQVASSNSPAALEYPHDFEGVEIDAGLARFAPHEIVLHPVSYRDHRHGVLVLAASRPVTEGERGFIERLAAQLGVALHNLKQLDDVRELADELRVSLEDIARKNALLEGASRMKSEFLANMSHELRTPLNAIIGFSEVLRDGLVGEMPEKQREYVSDIFESGQHLLALINDILDLSKIEAGKLELDVEPLELGPLLSSAMSIVREKAATHRIALDLEVDPALGTIRGDARKTRQIVFNLLSNAIKFSPEGGRVALRAELVPRARAADAIPGEGAGHRLALPESDADRFVEISVRDLGIGLGADDMAKLFQPFVQIESSLSRQYEGTGLGLAMVRRLAELHGGTVAVSSTPGRGSCFTVWLPYRPTSGSPAASHETAPTAVRPGADASPLALIIEDDSNSTELMRSLLAREGYRVATARTAEEGLEMAHVRPSVIVLDILLPGMDGWACLARIRQTPSLADVPVVIVSMVADREKGRALGAAAVLQKPIRREELLSAVGRFSHPGPGDMRVLVVDDDPKAVELAAVILAESGCRVLRAHGGQEGIDLALRELPDLIVLDLMMPGVNGFDVVARLRTDARTAQVPILVLTSKVLTEDDHVQLGDQVQSIVAKVGFGREAFINEVRRAYSSANAARSQAR